MESQSKLKKTLGKCDVWSVALGAIIGWGCFILPGEWISIAGPLGSAIAVAIGGILMLIICNSYGFLVKELPVAGGEFAYTYYMFGRNNAYICGWFLALGFLSIVPINATALGVLAKLIFPSLFARGYLYTIAGWDVYVGEVIVATLVLVVFAILNYKGVDVVGKLQFYLVVIMIVSIILLVVGTVANPNTIIDNLFPLYPPNKPALTGIVAIVALAPFAYVGFNTIPQAAEEFAFSADMAYKLMFVAIVFGTLCYVSVSLCTALAFPWQLLIESRPEWATGDAIYSILGKFGLYILSFGVVMGILTGVNGFYFATSRLLLSMGRANILPNWFAIVHPEHKTPSNAILFICFISLLAPWFGRRVLNWVVDMSAVGTAMGYFYTCFAAYQLRKKLGINNQVLGRFASLIGMIISLIILALLLIPGMPAFLECPSLVALAIWLAIGMIFYLIKGKGYRNMPKEKLDYMILGI